MMNFVPSYDIELTGGESSNSHDLDAARHIVEWLIETDAFKSPDLLSNGSRMLTFTPFLNSLSRFKFCYDNIKYEAILNLHRSGPTASSKHLSVSLQLIN